MSTDTTDRDARRIARDLTLELAAREPAPDEWIEAGARAALDADAGHRPALLRGLFGSAHPAARAALERHLEQDPLAEARLAALDGARIDPGFELDALACASGDADPRVRLGALEILAGRDRDLAARAGRIRLDDDDADVRALAVSLARAPAPQQRGALQRALALLGGAHRFLPRARRAWLRPLTESGERAARAAAEAAELLRDWMHGARPATAHLGARTRGPWTPEGGWLRVEADPYFEGQRPAGVPERGHGLSIEFRGTLLPESDSAGARREYVRGEIRFPGPDLARSFEGGLVQVRLRGREGRINVCAEPADIPPLSGKQPRLPLLCEIKGLGLSAEAKLRDPEHLRIVLVHPSWIYGPS